MQERSYPIKEQDVEKIHNGNIQINNIVRELRGVLHPDKVDELISAMGEIYNGISETLEKRDQFIAIQEKHFQSVKEIFGIRFTEWNKYDVDNLLIEHPYEKAKEVFYSSPGIGKAIQMDIEPTVFPRWVDIWLAFERAVTYSFELGEPHKTVFLNEFFEDGSNPHLLKCKSSTVL